MYNRNKLFWGSCLALLTTAFCFTVITGIAYPLRQELALTNAQVGVFTGVFFIGFTISQVIFSPLCDIIGMRWIVRGAFVGHVAGAILLFIAPNYVLAVAGSLGCGLGAGLVEAGCNPLVAALYPKDKTSKLNLFHMWFPFGNLIAAVLLSVVLVNILGDWRDQMFLIFLPALCYGFMMIREPYPPTEGVKAGVSVGESFKALLAPIMLLMMPMMLLTASMELPPSSWVPAVLTAGGINGLLVFGFIFGIMGVLRLFAAPVVRLLTPTGILFFGSILATVGLYLFSQAESTLMAFVTAAIWAAGIAYFWPTMLGLVSERNPKSGALGLGVMGAIGMLASFLVAPYLGNISDRAGHAVLHDSNARDLMVSTVEDFSALVASDSLSESQNEDLSNVIVQVEELINPILALYDSTDVLIAQEMELMSIHDSLQTEESAAQLQAVKDKRLDIAERRYMPEGTTTKALRAIAATGLDRPVVEEAQAMLDPADNFGGRSSFEFLAPFGLILVGVFGFMFFRDRMTGGYKPVELVAVEEDDEPMD